ncbi:conserved hypothetical protein [Desulfonatronospira thiodismutans ASO3-1]|uniref:Uncharacterized protein n=1 Tax=Desulfonatronospira thiodismutans ASO3-1 TaxID=555779 RepID=D6SRV9_9BACT|nr:MULTISPECIES: hypothetical protein [Desulfonatronospira]EFI33425.1 conserved hypothetical protein [Desulfonatronospira thiodismutans ASO3-1]RQD76598.1 MAG: hypothetical protein D5S03_05940 [Desulfonatronospira sp. MSAO_Bac3]
MILSLLFLTAGLLALACGIVVLVRPGAVNRLSLPVRQALQAVNPSIRLERYYYRHHRITGPVTVLGGVLLCFAAWLLSGSAPAENSLLVFYQALTVVFFIFGAAIAVIGVVVTIRPSALKPLEKKSNRFISKEDIINLLKRLRQGYLNLTARHPRVFGLLAALGGLLLIFLALQGM